jgi:hypothetical protein
MEAEGKEEEDSTVHVKLGKWFLQGDITIAD